MEEEVEKEKKMGENEKEEEDGEGTVVTAMALLGISTLSHMKVFTRCHEGRPINGRSFLSIPQVTCVLVFEVP